MKYTLRQSSEIEELFQNGKKIQTPYFMLLYLPANGDLSGKIAYIAGKKIGNAVYRNKAKRILRLLVERNGGQISGYKCALVARKQIFDVSFSDIEGIYRQKVENIFARNI